MILIKEMILKFYQFKLKVTSMFKLHIYRHFLFPACFLKYETCVFVVFCRFANLVPLISYC